MKLPLCLLAILAATAGAFALTPGANAPDFTLKDAAGKEVKLSDYKGKTVVVDFWATWCGPCKQTMPHMEALHKKFGAQGLVILGVCVWDTKGAFDTWQKTPQVPTSYVKVFDRAGRDPQDGPATSIAKKLYSVSGIPTFYLVGPDGNILYSGVGSGSQTEAGLDQALAKSGFKG